MKRITRIIGIALVAALSLGTVAACSTTADPDVIGLYYAKGSVDGNHFDHCFNPGSTTDYTWNNEVVFLPVSLRTWNIAHEGGDSTTPITVNSKPEPNQPSGVQVNLWPQTNFSLNTYCGADNKDKNSPVVQFNEKIARRYGAKVSDGRTTDGWRVMMQNTIVTALETSSRSVAREYTADQLVSGVVREEVQGKIAELFQTEIKRVVGGDYFCSPTFSAGGDCGQVQILLKDVDYTNPDIQKARDEKQAAIEHAAALVAEAQGKVDAANKTGSLYQNEAWVQLQIAQQQLEACKAAANCVIIFGDDGTFNISPGSKA